MFLKNTSSNTKISLIGFDIELMNNINIVFLDVSSIVSRISSANLSLAINYNTL